MIGIRDDFKVFIATQPVDFRSGINRLAALVVQVLAADPYEGSVFLFRPKRSLNRLKLIHWDGSGMILVTKWLEAGRFVWPPVRDGAVRLTAAQMSLLIAGLDWTRLVDKPVKRPTLAA